jgi:4-diphosphocytidyl-2-C-methyl-D-erythritol kinase
LPPIPKLAKAPGVTITERAPAKINLALHIRRKRSDGYHDLETLFAFARDGDTIMIGRAERNSLTITGPFAAGLEGENLVSRAAVAFATDFAVAQPHAITLDKHLPIASGIGGGSADAAATLRGLARLHGVDPLDERLFAIAARLGSDVPACLLGRPSLGLSRGERLDPLPPFGDLPLLLVNPRVPLSTAAMFATWDRVDHGPIPAGGAVLERAAQGRNDFTAPAIAVAPVVGDVLALLEQATGATLARMSGSGATCFALFTDAATRDRAAREADRAGWWTLATTLD